MLQVKNIRKEYKTGDLVQVALDDVSLTLRDNEFVAVLGPSGSGKTTLLNVIGGLDRYDSGDLIINGISTKEYDDRDWDSYRNHTIGFVFQSYNLISHQTVLSNVELALTISGISPAERKERALKALEEVGLADQVNKKPNQLSGGQMQRVAIARALVNNPDILLADEPTGALDSETSLQIMDLMKQVAKDRLVVMVTHNPELAEKYATRIVTLKDGRVTSDSDPYTVASEESHHENMGHSSMSFLTALQLSFNNLRTKLGRTLLTSFAGSIGIIGIALILAFSTGVNNYIEQLQKDTMLSYPVSIEAESMDIGSFIETAQNDAALLGQEHQEDGTIHSNGSDLEYQAAMNFSLAENNLAKFKTYLDNPDSEINKYVGENGVVYQYGTSFKAYTYDTDGVIVDTDDVYIDPDDVPDTTQNFSLFGGSNVAANWGELLAGNNQLISDAVLDSYDVVYGSWPTAYNEVVLVVNQNKELTLTQLYEFGYLPAAEYDKLQKQMEEGKELDLPNYALSYDTLRNKTLYVVPACDQYHEQPDGTYAYIANNGDLLKALLPAEIPVKIVGIVCAHEDADITIESTIGYTKALSDYIIDYTNKSSIVKAQKADPKTNVLNGEAFEKQADMSKEELSSYASMFGLSDSSISSMYDSLMGNGSYEDNLAAFGVVDPNSPSGINIYVDSFEDKEKITECIDNYNKSVDEKDQITYTDMVGLLMGSVTKIVDVISYVLIAFVAVSLVVSSIMIGIITYISVLERTKEIGILRALGASKKNISNVFNAETFFVGLFAGIIGVCVAGLLTIPINALIHTLVEDVDIAATLPIYDAIILIALSVFLTFLGGLIPAKKASHKDPVVALRTE